MGDTLRTKKIDLMNMTMKSNDANLECKFINWTVSVKIKVFVIYNLTFASYCRSKWHNSLGRKQGLPEGISNKKQRELSQVDESRRTIAY